MEIEAGESLINPQDTLLAKYSPPQSVQDDLDCKAQIAEAFDKRDRLLDVGRTLFDVREYGVGLVCPTNFSDRTPTLISNLKQCINEAQLDDGVPLKSIIVVSFDKANKNSDNRQKVEDVLKDALNNKKIGFYQIVEAEPHSTARSFNVGIEATVLHDWDGNPPAYVIQVDDDSRYEAGGLNKVALAAHEHNFHVFSSVTARPAPEEINQALRESGAEVPEYYNDIFFSALQKQYKPFNNDFFPVSPLFNSGNWTDLVELMCTQGHTSGLTSTWPATPNENGRGGFFDLWSSYVTNIGRAVPESRKGGEGPAQYMTLPSYIWPKHVGVIPVRLFDRNFVAGIETSNIMWGYGDRIRAMALWERGLTPKGLIARDVINGKVVNHHYPDCPLSISMNFPSVLKKHCALWHTKEGRAEMSHYDDSSGVIKPLPQHLIDSIERAVFVTEKALDVYERTREHFTPEEYIYGDVNPKVYRGNSNAYTAQSSFLKIGGFINRAICELGEVCDDGSLNIPPNINMNNVFDHIKETVCCLDCYPA